MASCDLSGLPSKIMLHCECDNERDSFISFWCTLPSRQNVKGLEVKELLDFLVDGFLPQGIVILFIYSYSICITVLDQDEINIYKQKILHQAPDIITTTSNHKIKLLQDQGIARTDFGTSVSQRVDLQRPNYLLHIHHRKSMPSSEKIKQNLSLLQCWIRSALSPEQ